MVLEVRPVPIGQVNEALIGLPEGAVIVDVEPMLARWDEDSRLVRRRLRELTKAMPDRLVIPCTNSGRFEAYGSDGGTFVHRARKPFTQLSRLRLANRRISAVVGDSFLTDGLLAWRLGVPFVLIHYGAAPNVYVQLQQRIGAFIMSLLEWVGCVHVQR